MHLYLPELLIIIVVIGFLAMLKNYKGKNVSKFITTNLQNVYDKFSPYSYRVVKEKTKELGQEYTPRQYLIQVLVIGGFAAVIVTLYFYNLVITIFYVIEYIVNLFLNKYKFILQM